MLAFLQEEEAIERAEAAPHAPFVAEQMLALGLESQHSQAVLRHGRKGVGGFHAGVAPGVWAETALEMGAVRGNIKRLVALSMRRVEALSRAL